MTAIPVTPHCTPIACFWCVVGVNSTGQDEIQFTLNDAGGHRRRRRHLEVTMATVNVLLGPRLTSHSRRSLGTACMECFHRGRNWRFNCQCPVTSTNCIARRYTNVLSASISFIISSIHHIIHKIYGKFFLKTYKMLFKLVDLI